MTLGMKQYLSNKIMFKGILQLLKNTTAEVKYKHSRKKKKHLYKVWKMRKSKSRFVGNASSFQTSTYSYHYQVSWSGWSWFCWLFHSSLLRTKNSKRVIANNKKKKSVTSGALLGPSALCLLCNNPLQNCHQNKWMYHHLN